MTQPTWFNTLEREFESPMVTVPAVPGEDVQFILVMAGSEFHTFTDTLEAALRNDTDAAVQFEASCEAAGL
jgi:hypothetical protein